MAWLRHVIVAAATFAASAAAAGPADKALAVLVACDAGALAKIGDSNAAFEPATIVSKPGTRSTEPPATYELDEATFAKPAEAYGLHLFGFVRYVVAAQGKTRAVSFGFRAAEPAPRVAAKLSELLKDVDVQQRGEEYGWLVELEPDWHTDGDGSAIEHRHPLRFVHVAPSPVGARGDATLIECSLAEARIGRTPPPKLADIFVANGTGAPQR